MSWIGVLIAVIVLAVFVKAIYLVWRPIAFYVNGLARVECRAPRVKPSAAALMPAGLTHAMRYHCTRWKHHDGPHEAETDVEIAPGEKRKQLVQWTDA